MAGSSGKLALQLMRYFLVTINLSANTVFLMHAGD